MNVGRNDACPCGSGKKFKKCCIDKKPASTATPAPKVERPPPAERAPRELTPQERLWETLTTNLAACETPEAKVTFVREAIDRESDLDGETLLDLALAAFDAMERTGERQEVDAFVARIRERHPEGYEEVAPWLEQERAEIAIDLDAPYAADALQRFAAHAQGQSRLAEDLIDQLSYAGRMDLLMPFVAAVWPSVRDDDVFDWVKSGFASTGRALVVARWHEAGKVVRADDRELLDALEQFAFDGEDDDAVAYASWATVSPDRRWASTDFSMKPTTDALWEPFAALIVAFGAALRARGWSSPRASMGESEVRSAVRSAISGKGADRVEFALLPSGAWLAAYAAKEFANMASGAQYRCVAFLAALEPWAEFLASQGLIHSEKARASVIDALGRVDAAKIVSRLRASDPRLRADAARVLGSIRA